MTLVALCCTRQSTDRRTSKRTDRWTDGWTNGRTLQSTLSPSHFLQHIFTNQELFFWKSVVDVYDFGHEYLHVTV